MSELARDCNPRAPVEWEGSIAEGAGFTAVSIATVSRVINGVPYPVSDCARRPILRTIRNLESRPDALARSLHQRTARER